MIEYLHARCCEFEEYESSDGTEEMGRVDARNRERAARYMAGLNEQAITRAKPTGPRSTCDTCGAPVPGMYLAAGVYCSDDCRAFKLEPEPFDGDAGGMIGGAA